MTSPKKLEVLEEAAKEVQAKAVSAAERAAIEAAAARVAHANELSSSLLSDNSDSSQVADMLRDTKLAPIEVPISSTSGAASMEHMSDLMKLVADSLGDLRSITKEAASVAMKQNDAIGMASNLIGELFSSISDCSKETKDAKLEKQEMTALVNELSRQIRSDREQNEVFKANEKDLQEYIRQLEAALEGKDAALQEARQELQVLQQAHEADARSAMDLKAMHLEVEGQLDEFTEALRTERAQKEALKIAKQQLQSQLKHMVKAEKDLTKGLRDAHEQIEGQLTQLRNELDHERSVNQTLKSKKSSLLSKNKDLNAKLKAGQQSIEQLQAELAAAKAVNNRLSSDLKSERKALKAAAASEKSYQERAVEAEAHLQILREQNKSKPKKARPGSALKASGKGARKTASSESNGGGRGRLHFEDERASLAIVAVPDSYPDSPREVTSSAGSSGRDPSRMRHHAIPMAPADLS